MTARAHLTALHTRLRSAIAVGTDPFALVHANRLASQIEGILSANTDAMLDGWAGLYGPNGKQPGIEDVCRTLEASARIPLAPAVKTPLGWTVAEGLAA
jgi:hypothetical protein